MQRVFHLLLQKLAAAVAVVLVVFLRLWLCDEAVLWPMFEWWWCC